jgi:hypothetical protein
MEHDGCYIVNYTIFDLTSQFHKLLVMHIDFALDHDKHSNIFLTWEC